MAKATIAKTRGQGSKKLLHAIAYLLKTRKYASRQEHFNGSMSALVLLKALDRM